MDLAAQDDTTVRRTLAEAVAADERAHRFDLARPPLIRCALIRFGEDRSRLVLTFHHIVADGWSLPVLHRELLALYGENPTPSPKSPPTAATSAASPAPTARPPALPGVRRSPGSRSPPGSWRTRRPPDPSNPPRSASS